MKMNDEFALERERMVEEQIKKRGIDNEKLLQAMRRVPRHLFVPEAYQDQAYTDRALPIGEDQTISQPLMVAIMTDLLDLKGDENVLEIGTGSGYQAAILGELARQVITVERRPPLAHRARMLLERLGYKNVEVIIEDGTQGFLEFAPYGRIMVTAGAPGIPEPLVAQLSAPGRLIVPVGTREEQTLIAVMKDAEGKIFTHNFGACVFVPLIGEHGWKENERPA